MVWESAKGLSKKAKKGTTQKYKLLEHNSDNQLQQFKSSTYNKQPFDFNIIG